MTTISSQRLAALEADLVGWLPERRWFQGKARQLDGVQVVDLAELDHEFVLVLVEVTYGDGGTERYQLPLVPGDGPGGWQDALTDASACVTLARRVLDPQRTPTHSGATLTGRPVTGLSPNALDTPRLLGAEQSNTSVVFGQSAIMKVLRRLEAGVHPDVELTRALTEQGFAHVPAQHASLALVGDHDDTALAVLADFAAGSREGWALATTATASVAAHDAAHDDLLLPRLTDLGAAIAGMHVALAEAFGTVAATAAHIQTWADAAHAQIERVLDLAETRAPDSTAGVLERRADLHAAIDRLSALEPGDAGVLVRIHGDLHLGQVLLDADGRWQLLDFEGEPAKPLAVRRLPGPPLRDVAGMLRSFDYAAVEGLLASGAAASDPLTDALRDWRDTARERFLAGYRAEAGALLPPDQATVLAAFELDKAVYELGYELANRPAWVPIPVGGILRVAALADRVRHDQDFTAPQRETGSEGAPVNSTTWKADTQSVAALLDGSDRDPHRVLGLHETTDGTVVRVYRPDASEVEILTSEDTVSAERTHEAGFFEAFVPGKLNAADYRLRVTYPSGDSYELRDPYAFWPTLGDIDVYLAGEGRHEELWRRMGARVTENDGVRGTSFAVWAPNARSVRVVADFNSWDGRLHPMRQIGGGIWELFVPEVGEGTHYKYEVVTSEGRLQLRADPFAFATEVPPDTASRVFASKYTWQDEQWLAERREADHLRSPISIYELHLGSWRHHDQEGEGRPLTYRELADTLGDYLEEMGFTHVEFMPVAEHPFSGSWGYQVTGHFAPTSRFGDPDDFRFLVDHLHQRGIGVIVDWVPAHFPKDEFALAKFDGTALYEHADPRQGEHPDWGTLVFNFGRNEVRNFLLASALFWIEELHIDGLRVDAVASMLYLDYSRKEGEWVPNAYGGNENLESIDFLKEVSRVVYGRNPGVMTIAEESTAWPGVSRPVHLGGLGFGFKWNMGWMHDTLSYFSQDPIYRRYSHHELTFGLLYAWSENYILPLSHDEVVHGKRSLLDKMPGDRWQKFANLRALYAWMWAHPGKQLLFMGSEFGQWREWTEVRQLDWYLLEEADHAGLRHLVGDLNAGYRELPSLWQRDHDPAGFTWIDANNADENVFIFGRFDDDGTPLVCAANLSPVPRHSHRIGFPQAGRWRERLNTDAEVYGGSNVGSYGEVNADGQPWHDQPASAEVVLPPLATVWYVPDETSRPPDHDSRSDYPAASA